MSKPLVTMLDSANVLEAARLMAKKQIGALVITDESLKPIGIVTERDIICKVVAKSQDCKSKPCKNIKVSDIMTRDIITTSPDTTVLEVTKIMTKHNFRRLIVVKDGKAEGIVTARDLVQMFST